MIVYLMRLATSTPRYSLDEFLLRDSLLYLQAFTHPTRSELSSRVEHSQATIKSLFSGHQQPPATANLQRYLRYGDTQSRHQPVHGKLLNY
jgi:hypothetical protein